MRAAVEAFPELADFVRAVEHVYGDRLAGVFLYGSRARGEHRADSDYDVGVVLDDEGAILWQEVNRLADLALDCLLSRGIEIQAVPFRASEWLSTGSASGRCSVAGSVMTGLISKSKAAAGSAGLLFNKRDYDGAVSRAYYAMFDAARAYLQLRHNVDLSRIKTHAGILTTFNNLAII